jgi:hypothetical protein
MKIRIRNTFSKFKSDKLFNYRNVTVNNIQSICVKTQELIDEEFEKRYLFENNKNLMINQLSRFDKPMNKVDLANIFKNLSNNPVDIEVLCKTMSLQDLNILIRTKLYNKNNL